MTLQCIIFIGKGKLQKRTFIIVIFVNVNSREKWSIPSI